MKTVLNLVKINFISLLKTNSKKKKGVKEQKKFNPKTIFALAIGVLILGAGMLYAFMYDDILTISGRKGEVLPLILSTCALVSFFFSYYASSGMIYGGKDFEIVSSLPIKKGKVILAKFICVYITDIVITALVTIGAVIYQYAFSYSLSATSLLSFILMILVSPFVPMALSVLIGALISVISASFKRSNLVQTILLFAVVVGIMVFSFVGSPEQITIGIAQKLYFLYPLATNGLSDGLALLWYLLIGFGAIAFAFTFVYFTYYTFCSIITAKRTSKDYKFKKQKSASLMRALYKNELKRFFSIPTYVINGGFSAVFGVLGAVALIVFSGEFSGELGQALGGIILAFVPAVFAFIFCTSPTTTASVSLEGSSSWISRTLPLPTKDYLTAKLLVNLTINGLSAILLPIAIGIVFSLSAVNFILTFALAVVSMFFAGALGLLFDLLFTKYTWQNPIQVIKQGMPVLFMVLVSFGLSAVFGVIGYFLITKTTLVLVLSLAVISILAVVTHFVVFKKGESLIYKKAI